jgi:hypothetical protein
VQTVFARSGTHVWGRVVDTNYTAEVHEERQPGDIDLVDAVVVESLMRDAEVHLDAEDVATEDTPVAAIFRY